MSRDYYVPPTREQRKGERGTEATKTEEEGD
jgi:hypothetical protein